MTRKITKDRPLVTFALFAYNQEQYIVDAVNSALAQNYERLEIILSDDCSNDETYSKMLSTVSHYNGRHSVRLRQNTANLGLSSHVNAVFEEANGEIIVIAAGDDISDPKRCEISVALLEKFPLAAEVLVSAQVIDEKGNVVRSRYNANGQNRIQNFKDLLMWRHKTFGAGRALRRRVHDDFGPLNKNCPTEDTPFLLRSMISGGSVLSDAIGVKYRVHDKNLSGRRSMVRMNIEQIYSQYHSDLETAKELELITDQEKVSLNEWMKLDYRARIMRNKMNSNEHLDFSEFLEAWAIPSFSVKDRLKALALIILGKRNENL